MKKFELTTDSIDVNGVKLFRIKSLVDFGNVKAGTIGGYVEKEENLSQYGNAWVYGNARVFDDARVFGNALVYGNARVYGNALLCGNAWMCGDAQVYGNALICGNACVCGDALVCCDAEVSGNADYICFKGFGSMNRNTTMFKTKDGNICVSCGCFHGTLQEFEEKVKVTHGDSKFAREYLACVEAAKIHFEV